MSHRHKYLITNALRTAELILQCDPFRYVESSVDFV